MKKRILSIVLTLCMVLMLVPSVAFAEGISDTEALQNMLDACEGEENVVTLDKDYTIASMLQVGENKSVILDLNGYVIKMTGYNYNPVIKVRNGGNLILQDSASNAKHDDESLPAGGVITGSLGSGVFITDNGNFTMNGGTIYNCSASIGGGVQIADSNFTMNGGTIYNCSASISGGGVSIADSNFTMNGGAIYGCSANQYGNAVYANKWSSIYANGGMINGGVYSWGEILNTASNGGCTVFYGDITNNGIISGKTVTFLKTDSEKYAIEIVAGNGQALAPAEPTRDGNEFAGWYNGDARYDFTQNVTDNIILEAQWESNESPVITGLKDNKIYCDTVEFEVSDNVGVASVTANDVVELIADTDGKYTLEKGIGEVTVVAKDNANNETSVTVRVNDGHTGGEATATCISKAVCEICKNEYGELDSSNHTGGTETRGYKSPSCTEAGYTGDTYCKGCGAMLSSGGTITKSAHNLENIPAKDATATETGNIEYWQCKNCKQCFSDKDGKNTIELKDTVIAKLPPEIVEGKGQSITEGEKKELTFRSNAAFGDFIGVELDGETLDETNYTVKEGSTVVTLKADYAAALSVGEHTIGIVSESGTATTTFTVKVRVNAWDKTVLRPQATASKTSIKIKWNAVPEADGYVIYWNQCGAKSVFKQIKVINSGQTLTWTHKGLKKGSLNKYYVKAYKMIGNKKQFIKTSKQIHLATEGGKYTNVKKLQSGVSSVTLKKGQTKALKVTSIYAERNKKPVTHMRTLAYTTSNKKVASVTSKGVIKAEGKGSCYIYITASSGVYTRVKVVVK